MTLGNTKDIIKTIKNDLDGGEITYENVRRYIERCGWLIVQYGNERFKSADEMLAELDLIWYAYNVESFVYEDGSHKLIFINVNRKADILFLLLHEVAHIKAGHTKQDGIYGRSDKAAERQANRIVRGVLCNNKLIAYTHKQPIKTAVIGGICCTIIFCTAYIGGTAIYNNRQLQQEQQTNSQIEPTPEASEQDDTGQATVSQDVTRLTGGGSSGGSGNSNSTQQAPQQPRQPVTTPYQPPATQAPAATPQPTQAPTEPPAAKAVIPQGQTVWMSSDGGKYHTFRDCQSIKNKTNVAAYDISEVATKYGKCQHCINRGG